MLKKDVDWSLVQSIETITLNDLDGWINPLTIEYGTTYYNELLSFFWRIKDNDYTFIISVREMEYLSKGDYAKHFKETLDVFKEDFKNWKEEYGFAADWMQGYKRSFEKYIRI